MSSRTSSKEPVGPSGKRGRLASSSERSSPQSAPVARPPRASRPSEDPSSSSHGLLSVAEDPARPRKRRRNPSSSPGPRDSDREPSTEADDDSTAARGSARTSRRLGAAGAAIAVKSDPDDEDEPSTAESDDEPVVFASSRTLPARSSRNVAPVLNLTDSGDEGFSSLSPGLASGSSSRPVNPVANGVTSTSSTRTRGLKVRPGDSLFGTLGDLDDDDDESLVFEDAAAVRARRLGKGKGKGKARDASTPPIPLADATSSANNIAATSADGEALPSLSHLTCPICFGPPAPLALTLCGHAFCAPCLHAALVAGPALTPPPTGTAGGGRGRGGRMGPMGEAARLFNTSAGARGRGRGVRGGGAAGSARELDDDDEGDPELNKHCPVCRTPLYGGWGKSLRGLVLRMAPVKR